MKMSLPGLVANLTAMTEDLSSRVENGEPIDEDFIAKHQPGVEVFLVGEVLRTLRAVAADHSLLGEFLDFVGVEP